jgi:hypothetical protein
MLHRFHTTEPLSFEGYQQLTLSASLRAETSTPVFPLYFHCYLQWNGAVQQFVLPVRARAPSFLDDAVLLVCIKNSKHNEIRL